MMLKNAISFLLIVLAATAIISAATLAFKEIALPRNTTTYANKETLRATDFNSAVELLGDDRGGGWP
ncbi:MAG: hypothetical protein QHH18_07365 [Candidatus Bathyarchaeota archaeon]|jgi:hypothetical protein|nr:hypothetical protein [Candidatus Bathyarchaeota archaeon A05DMB-5]MDH7558400.1 hypothetical protein [Candidatus Bathyarchaeota archaeon]